MGHKTSITKSSRNQARHGELGKIGGARREEFKELTVENLRNRMKISNSLKWRARVAASTTGELP